jgi:antitoxin component of MazEF toxin-antitoxin module
MVMQIQKVFKAGNSDAVVISPEIKKKTGIKTGSKIIVDVASDGKTIVINEVGSKKAMLTTNFFEWMSSFNREYGSALAKLAKK